MTPTIVARGDAQAAIVERMLGRACAGTGARIFCDQVATESAPERPSGLPDGTAYVTFPRLELGFLWPFSAPNPYDAEGDLGGLRFPYGDAFVIASLRNGYSSEAILASCFGIGWSDTWPDLEDGYARERARILALDARCDVKAAPFVLERFRKQPLFAALDAPRHETLRAIVERIAEAAGIAAAPVEPLPDDALAAIEVPIHPTVAEHFGLTWYDRDARYRNGRNALTYAQYFERMVAIGQMSRE